MPKWLRALIAGYGAKKLGGGCLSTILVFVIIYYALGQCNRPAATNHSAVETAPAKISMVKKSTSENTAFLNNKTGLKQSAGLFSGIEIIKKQLLKLQLLNDQFKCAPSLFQTCTNLLRVLIRSYQPLLRTQQCFIILPTVYPSHLTQKKSN